MTTSIDEIKELVHCLPEKDKNLANKFIITREFDKLRELVLSVCCLREKHKEDTNSPYHTVDEEDVTELLSLVTEYCRLIDPLGDDDYDDYDTDDSSFDEDEEDF